MTASKVTTKNSLWMCAETWNNTFGNNEEQGENNKGIDWMGI